MVSMYACKRSLHLFHTNLNFICKSAVSTPLSLRYFSTLREGEGEAQPATAAAVSLLLLPKHQFSLSDNAQKSESVTSFFKQIGLSESQLEKIFKSRKDLLTASLNNSIKPKIRIFQDFGFSPDEIAVIITEEPGVLFRATNKLIPSLSILKNLLGSSEKVVRVVENFGYFLTTNLEKTMVPNVEFLKSYGVPMENIRHLLLVRPVTLMQRPEAFRKIVEMVDQMGVDVSSKNFIRGISVVGTTSNENWELKLQPFRDLGFSEIEIVNMFRKYPQALWVSVAKLKGIVEAVIGTAKYSLSCIAKTPLSLGCSLEKRLIPRFHVLEKMNEEKWPALGTVCVLTDKKFLERYVVPHLNQVDPKHALQTALSMLNEGRN